MSEQREPLPMKWQHKEKRWEEYPIGTIARQSWSGFMWTKTYRGWRANGGDTFAIPGDSDQVLRAQEPQP